MLLPPIRPWLPNMAGYCLIQPKDTVLILPLRQVWLGVFPLLESWEKVWPETRSRQSWLSWMEHRIISLPGWPRKGSPLMRHSQIQRGLAMQRQIPPWILMEVMPPINWPLLSLWPLGYLANMRIFTRRGLTGSVLRISGLPVSLAIAWNCWPLQER